METNATLTLLLEETRKIRNLLDEHVKGPLRSSPGQQADGEAPEHVDITWITDYFQISKSTFYEEVEGALLEPVLYIGRRPYYLKSDVIELMKKRKETHLGFKKLNAQRKTKD